MGDESIVSCSPFSSVAGQHGPGAGVLANGNGLLIGSRRIGEGNKFASRQMEDGVGGGEGPHEDRILIVQGCGRHGRLIQDAHRDFKNLRIHRLSHNLDQSLDPLLPTADHSRRAPAPIVDRFQSNDAGKQKGKSSRHGNGAAQGQRRKFDFTFHGLLPGLKKVAIHPKFGDRLKGRGCVTG